MRLTRWESWASEVFTASPAVAGVESFAVAGVKDKPCGTVVTLRTGAKVFVQWVRTAPTAGEDQSEPEIRATGPLAAPVKVPDLPASGQVPVRLIEEHLAALIIKAQCEEIRDVRCKSSRTSPGPRPCGLTVQMHSGATVFGVFLYTVPPGARSGGEYVQKDMV